MRLKLISFPGGTYGIRRGVWPCYRYFNFRFCWWETRESHDYHENCRADFKTAMNRFREMVGPEIVVEEGKAS